MMTLIKQFFLKKNKTVKPSTHFQSMQGKTEFNTKKNKTKNKINKQTKKKGQKTVYTFLDHSTDH